MARFLLAMAVLHVVVVPAVVVVMASLGAFWDARVVLLTVSREGAKTEGVGRCVAMAASSQGLGAVTCAGPGGLMAIQATMVGMSEASVVVARG